MKKLKSLSGCVILLILELGKVDKMEEKSYKYQILKGDVPVAECNSFSVAITLLYGLDKTETNWEYTIKKYDDKVQPGVRPETVFVKKDTSWTYVPDACKNCSLHPSNGGSGNCCNCALPYMTTTGGKSMNINM